MKFSVPSGRPADTPSAESGSAAAQAMGDVETMAPVRGDTPPSPLPGGTEPPVAGDGMVPGETPGQPRVCGVETPSSAAPTDCEGCTPDVVYVHACDARKGEEMGHGDGKCCRPNEQLIHSQFCESGGRSAFNRWPKRHTESLDRTPSGDYAWPFDTYDDERMAL